MIGWREEPLQWIDPWLATEEDSDIYDSYTAAYISPNPPSEYHHRGYAPCSERASSVFDKQEAVFGQMGETPA